MLLFGDVMIIKPVNIYYQLQVLTFFPLLLIIMYILLTVGFVIKQRNRI